MQAVFTVTGLALATGILIVPNCFRDGVREVMDFQWDVVQRQDVSIGLVEPASSKVTYLLEQLPGVVSSEPFRHAAVRLHFGPRHRQIGIQGLVARGLHNRVIDSSDHEVPLPPEGLIVSAKLADVLGARVGDEIIVEVLQGRRLMRSVRLAGGSRRTSRALRLTWKWAP